MAQKIGFYSIRKYARLMCKFIFIFTPAIRKAYPDNQVILTLLAAAHAACEALVEEIDNVAPQGV